MNGKWFLLIYAVYVVALFIGYRFLVKRIEKKKLQKKLEQEQKLKNNIWSDSKNV